MKIVKGQKLSRRFDLIDIHFSRTNADVKPGTFRALGNAVDNASGERIIIN